MSLLLQRSAVATVTDDQASLQAVVAVARGVVRRDEDLREHTTLGIGGPADLWFEPVDTADLCRVLAVVRRERMPYGVVGGGSNLLVGDGGVRGLVVHLAAGTTDITHQETRDGVRVDFPAGVPTGAVRRWARANGLVGPEFLSGIPGSVGGALRMNAGTRMGEMVDVVESVEIALPEGPFELPAADLRLAYRSAALPPGAIVTRVRLLFQRATEAEGEALRREARSELARRRRTQPKGRSAGSIFKNPPGDHAGRLLEACGVKGRRVGDARVSDLHANFIVNEGAATARDVLDLVDVCRAAVRDRFGVHLELEVRLLGEF